MKKTISSILLFSVIILLAACKNDQKEPCNCPEEKDYSKTEMNGLIDANLAKTFSDAYKADKGKSMIDGTGTEDARVIWFKLETLKQYIWKMEHELKAQGCNIDSMGLGINIYYAKYPDAEEMKKLGYETEYALHHTAFLTATYQGDKGHIDFDPWNIGTNKCKPTPLSELMRGAGKSKIATGVNGATDTGGGHVLNNGQLKPPPFGSGNFPED